MKRIERSGPGLMNETVVPTTWDKHRSDCAKCQRVDVAKTASFALACAEGSPLLMERAISLQRPAQQEKERQVREWAKKAGTFRDA